VLQQGYWTDTDVDDIGYAWRYLVGKYQSLAFTWCGFSNILPHAGDGKSLALSGSYHCRSSLEGLIPIWFGSTLFLNIVVFVCDRSTFFHIGY
jgi:hypothetical protein